MNGGGVLVGGAAPALDLSTTSVVGLVGSVVVVVGTIFAARVTGRQSRQAAEVTARGPDWKAYTDALQADVAADRERREEDAQRIDRCEEDVRRLRNSVRDLRNRYRMAREHIREWQVWAISPTDRPPTPPDDLAADLDDIPRPRV